MSTDTEIDWETVDLSTIVWEEHDGDDPLVGAAYTRWWLQGADGVERDAFCLLLHEHCFSHLVASIRADLDTKDPDEHGPATRQALTLIIVPAKDLHLEQALDALAAMLDSEHDDVAGIGLNILDTLADYVTEHPHPGTP